MGKKISYNTVAIAGTFDRLHRGHRYFLSQSIKLGRKVIIGLTSDTFVQEKLKSQNSNLKTNVNNYIERKKELEGFLKKEKLLNRAEIVSIDDVYGPACPQRSRLRGGRAIEDNEIEALVVTEETLEGGKNVNIRRKELGFKPLRILKLPLIIADDRKKIASTRIRQGEIDRWGKLYISKIKNQKSKISEKLRQEFKKPIGLLISGNQNNLHNVAQELKTAVGKTNSILISTVGDEVTKLCNEIDIRVHLAIFDYRVRREEKYHSLKDLGFKSTFARVPLANGLVTVKNPAGNITNELVETVKNAYTAILTDGKQRVIQVDGEEDLAGVPAILLAPLGSLVIYGQPPPHFSFDKLRIRGGNPGEGVVVVEVTEEKKQTLLKLLEI